MNGFIEKYKANADRLEDSELEQLAADMEAGGYDATDEQWSKLNDAVAALPDEAKGELKKSPDYAKPAESDHYVSSAEPGTLGNPIGYPGTTQDQDGPPEKRPDTVPGQKPLKKPDEKSGVSGGRALLLLAAGSLTGLPVVPLSLLTACLLITPRRYMKL